MLSRTNIRSEHYEAVTAGDRMLSRAFHPNGVSARPRAVLIQAGEPRRELLLLRHGWALRARPLPHGKRAVLDIYLPGDLIGTDAVLTDQQRSDTVVALTPVVYHTLPLDGTGGLMEKREVLLRLLREADRARARIEALAVAVARQDAEGRLAGLLLGLYRRLRRRELVSGRSFRLPLTQQEIGDHLGLTVVHVNRVLRHLREEHVVMVQHRTAVITDLDRLRWLAGEAPAGAAAPAEQETPTAVAS